MINYRIIEYPELEDDYKDHEGQHSTTQKSDHMSESIVQMHLEPQQAQYHDHSPGEPVLVPDLAKNFFLIPNLNLSYHSSMLFPQVLLLVRDKRSAPVPSLPLMRSL